MVGFRGISLHVPGRHVAAVRRVVRAAWWAVCSDYGHWWLRRRCIVRNPLARPGIPSSFLLQSSSMSLTLLPPSSLGTVRRSGREPASQGALWGWQADAGCGGEQQEGTGMHAGRNEEEAREGERVPRPHVERWRPQGAQGEAREGQEAVGAGWPAGPQVGRVLRCSSKLFFPFPSFSMKM